MQNHNFLKRNKRALLLISLSHDHYAFIHSLEGKWLLQAQNSHFYCLKSRVIDKYLLISIIVEDKDKTEARKGFVTEDTIT